MWKILSDFRTMPSTAFGPPQDQTVYINDERISTVLLRRLFNDLDTDRDLYLSKIEVCVALHRLNISVSPVKINLFFKQAASLNKSNLLLINFAQFVAFVSAAKEETTKAKSSHQSKPIAHSKPNDRVAKQTLDSQPNNFAAYILDEDEQDKKIQDMLPTYILSKVLEPTVDVTSESNEFTNSSESIDTQVCCTHKQSPYVTFKEFVLVNSGYNSAANC